MSRLTRCFVASFAVAACDAIADPSDQAGPANTVVTVDAVTSDAETECAGSRQELIDLLELRDPGYHVVSGAPFPGETNKKRRKDLRAGIESIPENGPRRCVPRFTLVSGNRAVTAKLSWARPSFAPELKVSALLLEQIEFDARGRRERKIYWNPEIAIAAQLGVSGAPMPEGRWTEANALPELSIQADGSERERQNLATMTKLLAAVDGRAITEAADYFAAPLVVQPFDAGGKRFADGQEIEQWLATWLEPLSSSALLVRSSWAARDWVVAHVAHSYIRELGEGSAEVLTYFLWIVRFDGGRVSEIYTATSRRLEWYQLGLIGWNEFNQRLAAVIAKRADRRGLKATGN